ncbi:facilitated trehalose transporter Tret1-2 homolog [Dermatophagoides pteronyssinus]|uniref:Solute carrier 2 (Facilitated glucose transporter) member 8 n=1 Tax=Dermatophagoides pteronyssinus TaxID=6956 RepID=A0ABQ8JQ83_DERPT|nr:Solute carrier 2 (Facilitated glucose transporter) member 8 [Dermatophagoides pteronyssinus]
MADTTLLIDDQHHRTPKYYFAALSGWLGSFSMGTVLGYSAPALASFDQQGSHIHLNKFTDSIFASLMPFGAIIGSICAGFFTESFGRKGTLIFTTLPFVSGWILMAYSGNLDSLTTLMIGRFLTGFCCGLISLTVPVYIGETCDPAKRGFFGSGFQLTVSFGIVVTYVIGKYFIWSDLALFLTAFPLLLLLTILFMPESPVWLLKKGRISEATEANIYLHGAEGSRRMAVDITIPTTYVIEQDSNDNGNGIGGGIYINGNASIMQQFRLFSLSKYNRPLYIAIALMFFQQFSGVNAMIFFMTSIFERSKFESISPSDSTIIVGFIQVLATLLACFLSDKFGRRFLMIVSSIGGHLSLIPLAIYYYIDEKNIGNDLNIHYGWIPIVSMVFFIISFSLGLGPIPWLIMGEILPLNVKKLSTIIVSSFNWFCAFIIITFYNQLVETVSSQLTYLMFSLICLSCAIFNIIYLPETKGKSFQEIEQLFIQNQVERSHNEQQHNDE